jgi:hypothetical protein
MVCQYSTRSFVSSEKHGRAVDPEAAEGGDDAPHIATGTGMVVSSRVLPISITAIIRKTPVEGGDTDHAYAFLWPDRCGIISTASRRDD